MRKFYAGLSACLVALGIAVGFQNCGKGFAAAGFGEAEGASTVGGTANLFTGMSKQVKALPLSPQHVPNDPNNNETLFPDFSDLLQTRFATGLKSVPFLSDGLIALSVDTSFPSELANPADDFMAYAVTSPRYRQANAYQHVHAYLEDLYNAGLRLPGYPLLKLDANCGTGLGKNLPFQGNAYYSQPDHYVCMGRSTVSGQTAWSSLDADVLVHEFTHSLNHHVATTGTMSSTLDAQALDEGLSDALAFLQNEQPMIARWFGRAILTEAGVFTLPFSGLRDLAKPLSFPQDRILTRHDDGRFISIVVRDLLLSGVSKDNLRLAIFRALESESGQTMTFDSFYRELNRELVSLGVSRSMIDASLSKFGLLRKDQASSLALDATKPYYIVDNHALAGFHKNGNCDGALDAGETVLFLPNLRNSGTARLATVTARLKSDVKQSAIKILDGGDVGTFVGFNASATYPQSFLAGLSKTGADYLTRLIYPSFALEVAPGASGTYAFTLEITAFDTADDTPTKKTIPISFTVGSDANVTTTCGSAAEMAVMP